ncbi:ceramide-1-phosphate transfer protein-like [Plakobranchus ocellatus]|uniref:Ceramide-1-phosphate transfer protein-like n=1 Tax=Plakobranchus ocellatus TaxID=259542 RepID=A0AAV3YXW5_9GAST|nr:ceramide-1-phosphate transfer protein-like [Plakobranchus ocellatus]
MTFFENDTDKQDFNLEIVLNSLNKSLEEDGTVVLEEYLRAFHELCRFFKLTGRLLSFVARDLESKIKCVECHLHSLNWRHYHTVESMINFEQTSGTTHQRGTHPSGCRMVLRLHWALEFILEFMDRIRVSGEEERISDITWDVYRQTLYNHHPWATRKLAQVAVYALPSKKQLIEVMCKHDYGAVLDLLAQVVQAGRPVHEATQRLFSSHDLLHIP